MLTDALSLNPSALPRVQAQFKAVAERPQKYGFAKPAAR
jgi:hypothetical protein